MLVLVIRDLHAPRFAASCPRRGNAGRVTGQSQGYCKQLPGSADYASGWIYPQRGVYIPDRGHVCLSEGQTVGVGAVPAL